MVKVGDKLICIKEWKFFHDIMPVGFISEVLSYGENVGNIVITTPNGQGVGQFYDPKETGFLKRYHEEFLEHLSFDLYKALERDRIIDEILS